MIKFWAHLKKNTVEIILLLQEVIGNELLVVSTIKRWHKMFLNGKKLVAIESRGGGPKTKCMVMNIPS